MRFRRDQRIRQRADFSEFRTESISRNGAGFCVKIKKNSTNSLRRFAVIVSKRVGDAHERNRIKRIFREIFRWEQSRLDPQSDYLVVVQKGILPRFWELREQFLRACISPLEPFLLIAIDGTAASGKSSTARILARKHRLLNVNTGNHYRTLTFLLLQRLQNGPSSLDLKQVENWVQNFSFRTRVDGLSAHLIVDGVSPKRADLRSEAVNGHVALLAQVPQIRRRLREYQLSLVALAKELHFAGIVMEGRDIGSNILPYANIRIFLTADAGVRENRRRNEGERDVIAQRDAFDSARGRGAVIIDTTHRTLAEVIAIIEGMLS
jgi:cytidylate kinase/ribonuclease P protein component